MQKSYEKGAEIVFRNVSIIALINKARNQQNTNRYIFFIKKNTNDMTVFLGCFNVEAEIIVIFSSLKTENVQEDIN